MALSELMLAVFADGAFASRNQRIAALRSVGAVSPAGARPIGDLNVPVDDDTWRQLVIEGQIREGPPGHFYLFERMRPSTRQRFAKMLVFYVVILLIPILLVLASRKGG